MIQILKDFEKEEVKSILNAPREWQMANLKSMRIDYYPPVVERIWMQKGDLRFYFHVIRQSPVKDCLFHKHRWPSAIHILQGEYEMSLAYSEKNVSSEEAYGLPIVSKLILSPGSYYEMTEPHGLHYVNPLTPTTMSLMVSSLPYPEQIKEAEHPRLGPLADLRFFAILEAFKLVFD